MELDTSAMSQTLEIFFSGVSKTFKSHIGRAPTRALIDFSLELTPGEVFGLIGKNGAGKSTAIKVLMGFLAPDSGRVAIKGISPSRPESRRLLGYLPENPCLYDNLTAREHLAFALECSGFSPVAEKKRIEKALEQVDLAHAADKPVRTYSKGMVQRAALAFALVHEPDILVLDEPMSGLDPLGRQLVVDLIREYHGLGHTILFSSHILTDVERICNRIGILEQGRLCRTITPAELAGLPAPPAHLTPLEALFLQTVTGREAA